jgi:hypothetical protein
VTGELVSTTHEEEGGLVIPDVRMHGADDAEIVDGIAHSREDLRDRDSALAAAAKSKGRSHQGARGPVGPDLGAGERFAVVASQRRFGVEGVDLGKTAIEEEKDDVLGPGREMRIPKGQRLVSGCFRQQAGHSHRTEPGPHERQHFTSVHFGLLSFQQYKNLPGSSVPRRSFPTIPGWFRPSQFTELNSLDANNI